MEDITDRELRYLERERRQIEEQQRQTILELQRQRDAITQLRAEARVNQDRLARPASEPTEQATFESLQARRQAHSTDYDDRLPTDTVNQDRLTGQDMQPRQMLDYAGRLPTPSSSLYTLDDIDSQYSDRVFDRHDSRSIDRPIETVTDRRPIDSTRETDRDRVRLKDRQQSDVQIDMNGQMDIDRDSRLRDKDKVRNTKTEQFDMSKDRLTSDKDVGKLDTDLRNKSLPHRDKDETRRKIGQPIGQRLENEKGEYVPMSVGDREKGEVDPLDLSDISDDRQQPYTGYDLEEKELMARLADLSFEEKRVSEERIRRRNTEKEMERKLKALQLKNEKLRKEEERKEILKALKAQVDRMQAKLWKDQDESRRYEERMERMYIEAQKLEEQIADRDRSYRQSDIIYQIERDNTVDRKRQEYAERQFKEEENQKALEEELKRRETLFKQEMEDERRGKQKADDLVRQVDSQRSYMTEEEVCRQEMICRLQEREEAGRNREQASNIEQEQLNVKKERDRRSTSRKEQVDQRSDDQRSKRLEEELRQKEIELERKEEMLQRLQRQLDGQETEPSVELLRRKEELERKERYLEQLEQQLLNRKSEEKIDIKKDTTSQQAGITHFNKPYLTQFSGAEPTPKNESNFEDWKAEVQVMLKSKVYPDYIVTQTIRNSLKGQARKVLSTLDPLTDSIGILSKLESLFGNVASGLSVLQEFFTAAQREDESVTMWGLRIEEILQRAIVKREVTPERKNHLLKDKFWRSLHSLDLKIASKVYCDKCSDFEVLRSKVREEEYELKAHKTTIDKSTFSVTTNSTSSAELQHQPIQTQSGPAKMYSDITKRLENVEKRCFNPRFRYSRKNKGNDQQNGKQQQQQPQQQQQQGNKQQGQQQQQQEQNGQNKSDNKRTDNKTDNLNRDRPPLQGK